MSNSSTEAGGYQHVRANEAQAVEDAVRSSSVVKSTLLMYTTTLDRMNREELTTQQQSLAEETFASDDTEPQETPLLSAIELSLSRNPTNSVPYHQYDNAKSLDEDPEPLAAVAESGAKSTFLKQAKLIQTAAKIKIIKQAAHVIADFIPVVGNSTAFSSRSHLHQSRRPLDSTSEVELDNHPLHKACALSASPASSSVKLQGGDLSTIQALVEEDPERLYEQLLKSGCTPLHISIRFGAVQWHHMHQYPGGRTNLPIIEYLIQADVDFQRSKAIQARKQAKNTQPIILAALVSKSAMYQTDAYGDLCIHIAAHAGYDGAAKALLKVAKETNFGTILEADEKGNLPLHLAVEKDDLAIVELLLQADIQRTEALRVRRDLMTNFSETNKTMTLETLVKANIDGSNIPLHLALASPHKFSMWSLLLEPDERKGTLQIPNEEGVTSFRFFVDQPQLFRHHEAFVDEHLAEAILSHLLSGRRLDP